MEIFVQLGADSSLLYQFIIMVVVLILSKFFFLTHLQNILETRHEKTVKLEGEAEKAFVEVNKLKEEYRKKMTTANKELRAELDQKKSEISKDNEIKYKYEEEKINTEIDQKRNEAQQKAKQIKDSILSNASELSELLVNKVTKG